MTKNLQPLAASRAPASKISASWRLDRPLLAIAAALWLQACGTVPPPSSPPSSSSATPVAAATTAAPPAAGASTPVVVTPAPGAGSATPTAAAAAASGSAAPTIVIDESKAAAPAAPGAPASGVVLDDEPATAAGAPRDPLRPETVLSLEDEASRRDLWQRIRRGFAMPDLDNKLVRSREQWYADRPDYVQRMTERGGRYLFHIVEEVEKRGMPTELALLPFIESAYNPEAMSHARASGMWQFIPSTGRLYDLTQNVFRDDRRDVLASTRAALDYLQKLYSMFGDWHLALAAYNWGEGSVQRAMARNQRQRKPTDYMSLRMPNETRYYVPKLQAVKNIVTSPQAFGLTLPVLENHPYFVAVPIERDIDVALAIRLAEMPDDEFQTLNPSLNKPVILAAGTPQLLLPYDNANLFLSNLRSHKGALASWTAWVVPKTMKTAQAAKEVGMPEDELREVNLIPAGMVVRAGSTLLVPRADGVTQDVSERLADSASLSLAPDSPHTRRIVYRARRGESVRSVARRFGVPAAHVASWNQVDAQARFARGQSVIVYAAVKVKKALPAKRTAKAAKRPARGSSAIAAPKRSTRQQASRH